MPINGPTQGLSRADGLRAMVVAVITDDLAPISIRNHCHRLMLAIERNNKTLIDESLINLEQAAEDTDYHFPPLNLSSPTFDPDRSSEAPEPLGRL
jgi:hypothetical protein